MDRRLVSVLPGILFVDDRRYSRWFGLDGEAGPRMSSYAAANYRAWEQKIEEWQKPVLQNK